MTITLDDLAFLAWTQLCQLTLVAIVAGGVARFACRDRPRLAYALWMLVVVKALTPPLWSSPTGVFSWALAVQEIPSAIATEFQPAPILVSNTPTISIPIQTTPAISSTEPISARVVLMSVWGIGLGAFLIVAIGKQAVCSILIRQSAMSERDDLITSLSDLRRRLGVRRRVKLVVSSRPIGPAAFGFLRPMIVLPEILLTGKTSEQVELILAHELVHIKRGDILAGHLQLAAQVVWWFHPLVWWANREATRERERCCDRDVVEGVGCRPAAYARTLLSVVELKSRLRIPAAIPGVRAMEVTSQRLETIMRFRRERGKGAWLPRIAFACGAILLVPGAGLTLQAGSDEKPEQLAVAEDVEHQETTPSDPTDPVPTKGDIAKLELKIAEENLKWAEEMHKKGYVSKAQVEAERLRVQELTLPREKFERLRYGSELQQAEERLKWAEEMHKKGYVSDAQLDAERLNLMKLRLPRNEREIFTLKADLIRAKDRVDWAKQMENKGYLSKAQRVREELNLQQAKFRLEHAELIESDNIRGAISRQALAAIHPKDQKGIALKGIARERGTGRPIEGAKISFDEKHEAVTGKDGRYEFVDLPEAPEYTLGGGPKTNEPYFITSARIKPPKGEKTINLDLDFVRGIPFRVRVLDKAMGKPLLDPATGKPLQGSIGYFPVSPNDPYKRGAWGYSQRQENGMVAGAFYEAYTVDENGEYRGAVLPGPGVLCFSSPAVVKRKVVTDHEPSFFYPDGKDAVRIASYQNPKCSIVDLPIRGSKSSLGIVLNQYTAVIAINPKEDAKEVSYEIKLDPAEASK